MTIRDISVCITSADHDNAALDLAEQLAEASSAHITCDMVGILATLFIYNDFGTGAAYAHLLNESNAEISRFWKEATTTVQQRQSRFEIRQHKTFGANIEPLVAMIARHSDVMIVRAPTHAAPQPYAQIIEGALLGSGRPVIIVPPEWKRGPVGRNMVIGWDESREATRAMHDALLLAAPGTEITVVTVDARRGSPDHGDTPGLDIAAHLSRHGYKIALRNEASLGRSVSEVITQVATDLGADLIALGGYRHSRVQQALFGGVTRNMLREPQIPLLLSH